jgi:CheY-like chemotaxis protein
MPAKILVIEDDPASLELLKYLLERAGHSVATAMDGAAGLNAALENEFDIVLCDLQLPELTGLEVAARLRATEAWRVVPLVAVTAYSMPGDRDTTIAAGFTEYLTKPIEPESILSKVNELLPPPLRSLATVVF